MERYLKIESKDAKEEIKISDKCFTALEITFDSSDTSKEKADQIGSIITITCKLDENSRETSAILSRWALMKSTAPSAYRKLTVWIISNENIILRKMEYTDSYLVDYKEIYVEKNDNNMGTIFELKLKQKADRLEKITISCEPLTFSAEKNGFIEIEDKA